MILLNQAGRNRHEDICEASSCSPREVMPEFHASEPEHQEWKQAVLAGEIELDEIDTEPFKMLSLQSTKWKQAPGRRASEGRGRRRRGRLKERT